MSTSALLLFSRQISPMECPVCYRHVHHRRQVRLECDHRFCLRCATDWMVKQGHPTCPMCRKETSYFSRYTRSFDEAVILLQAFTVLFLASESCCFRCELLRVMVKPYMHLWHRPDMVSSRVKLRDAYTTILQTHADHISDECKGLILDMIKVL